MISAFLQPDRAQQFTYIGELSLFKKSVTCTIIQISGGFSHRPA
jgi:hypothetical protein